MIFLGIDSGTQSTKTIALDVETGEIAATAQASYELVQGLPPGHLEQHPEDWLQAVEKTVETVLAKLGTRRAEIAGIGVSGQQHGLVPLDAQSEVLRPAKLWCDTSTTAECAELTKKMGGPEAVIQEIGNAMLPGYTAPKILWLKNNEPAAYEKTRTFLLPHDYINFYLTGEKRMEFGDASGTALLNVKTRLWSKIAIEAIGEEVADKLPELRSSKSPCGLLREKLRKAWNLPEGVLVSAGGGDNMMGAIGTGNIRPGIFTVSLGTSGTIYAFSKTPVVDPQGEVAAFCDSTDHWLPLACTMNVTVATEQTRALLGVGIEEFDSLAASASVGSGGLLFLPYLNGERTPNLPEASGVLHGLTTRNMTRENLARAVLEGVTMGLAYGLRRLIDLGLQPREVRLTGGGSRSAVWRKIAADVFNTPVVCLRSPEGAAIGAAIQAAATRLLADGQAVSLSSLVERLVTLEHSTCVEPDSKSVEAYKQLALRQTDLTRRLKTIGYL